MEDDSVAFDFQFLEVNWTQEVALYESEVRAIWPVFNIIFMSA